MYDVVLFGGTDEGHKIADFLSEQKVSYVVCVATELNYISELLQSQELPILTSVFNHTSEVIVILEIGRASCRERV